MMHTAEADAEYFIDHQSHLRPLTLWNVSVWIKEKTCTGFYYCVEGRSEILTYCVASRHLWNCVMHKNRFFVEVFATGKGWQTDKRQGEAVEFHQASFSSAFVEQNNTNIDTAKVWVPQLGQNQYKGSPGAVRAKDPWNNCAARTVHGFTYTATWWSQNHNTQRSAIPYYYEYSRPFIIQRQWLFWQLWVPNNDRQLERIQNAGPSKGVLFPPEAVWRCRLSATRRPPVNMHAETQTQKQGIII